MSEFLYTSDLPSNCPVYKVNSKLLDDILIFYKPNRYYMYVEFTKGNGKLSRLSVGGELEGKPIMCESKEYDGFVKKCNNWIKQYIRKYKNTV